MGNNYSILPSINSPVDLKSLNQSQLKILSKELGDFIQSNVQEIGGHYSSPLGVIDLTLALHYVYESPKDKLIWDTGHQAYAHKIITGRRDNFKTIRQKDGLSGFLKRDENPHDIFGAGHASTSISAALGFAHARDKLKKTENIIAIIGDGAMTGGMAYEGLNNLGFHRTQMTVVLNDNSMSISHSVGALSRYLTKVVTNPTYNKFRNDIWNITGKMSTPTSNIIRKLLRKTEEGIKVFITPGVLFEELGLRYIGPVDGHNLDDLIEVFQGIKDMKTPVLVHVYTKKGKGCSDAEIDSTKYYSLSGNNNSGNGILDNSPSYSKVFGKSIIQFAENNLEFNCVTAAMEIGTGMVEFGKKYPDRYIDVGIAEEHAVTYAAGLSAAGIRPIVAIYSTFLQRAYDQIMHDCLLQNIPVIFCMDRAGLVGPDGPTHHGVFDIVFLRTLPGMIVTAPKDGNELRNLLATSLGYDKPFSIRYPKGSSISFNEDQSAEILPIGKWEILKSGSDIVIIAVGSMVNISKLAIETLPESLNLNPTLINARFIKPMDKKLLDEIIQYHSTIITVEEGAVNGGFGSGVLDYVHDISTNINVIRLGIPDQFIQHGTRDELLEELGLNPIGIAKKILSMSQVSNV